jgi:hypothetical protein
VAHGAHGLSALQEAADGPAQDHVAVFVGIHGDLVGVDPRVVCERLHDRSLERKIGHATTMRPRIAARQTRSVPVR